MLEGWQGCSPFAEVDALITSLVQGGGRRGAIRHWTYFPASSTLTYHIAGYRWCDNVRRQHRSNNIM